MIGFDVFDAAVWSPYRVKALVLGGSQFVGLHTVRELVARGHDVTVLNRGQTEARLPPGVERLVADRRNAESMRAALAGKEWDAVFDVSGFIMAAIGSSVSCGRAAWPPCPLISNASSTQSAVNAPWRMPIFPTSREGSMCMLKSASTPSTAPASIISNAPRLVSSAG